MENINPSVAHCPCTASYAKRSFNASQTQLAAINSSRSLDLDIVTEEGDKVTLSMDAKASALYASYAQIEGDDNHFAAKQGELRAGSFEREVSFSVEGNLNADERREIRKVIKTVNRMMRNFVKGKVKPMMAKAEKLEGLETIDSLELNMEYERNVVVARQSRTAVGYDQYGAVKEAPAAVTAASNTATPAAVATSSNADTSVMSLKAESRALSREMTREVISAQAPMANVLKGVDRLLQAYRNMARQWNPLGGQIMDQVRDLFDAAMGQTMSTESFDIAMTGEVDD